MRILIACLIFVFSSYSHGELKKAEDIRVTLEEETNVRLYMLPNNPIRIIFPFKLDMATLDPKLIISGNSSLFTLPDQSTFKGQNSFIISPNWSQLLEDQKVLGSVFVSLDGYTITFKISSTYRTTLHSDNVRFTLTEKDRNYLISKEIERREKALKKRYDKKLKDLDETARKKAFALYANNIFRDTDSGNVYLESELKSEELNFNFYLDEYILYSDGTYVVETEIENQHNKPFTIESITISSSDGATIELESGCSEIGGDASEICGITFNKPIHDLDYEPTITIDTNRGSVTSVLTD